MLTNEINGLGRPTPSNRGIDFKRVFSPLSNLKRAQKKARRVVTGGPMTISLLTKEPQMDVLSKAPPNDRRNSAAALADLAGRAGKFYRRSSEDRLACGNLLLEARKVCPHGEWSAFLEDAGIRQRTARRMLAFAMAGVQNGHVAVLGVRYIGPADRYVTADDGRGYRVR